MGLGLPKTKNISSNEEAVDGTADVLLSYLLHNCDLVIECACKQDNFCSKNLVLIEFLKFFIKFHWTR